MDCLLNDWMELFDNKNFESLKSVPKELKKVTMLFVTIKEEFKRVETSLSKKIEILQSTYESKSKANIKSEFERGEDLLFETSPSKENIPSEAKNTKTLLKSPTFSRHRKKLNLGKINKTCNQPSISSGLLSCKNLSSADPPKTLERDNKTLPDTIEDNDILDCSIIATTPNVRFKKTRSKWLSPKKRMKPLGIPKGTTLTQIFSEMVTKRETSKEESSMMDIEEIIDKVDTENHVGFKKQSDNHEKFSHSNIPKDINIASFVDDYDKVPELPNSTKNKFVYKETVRGNEKKKLKGWSCKDCENFYKGMRLTEKELEKKMDECSKHRSRFKPDEETMPGYWDLSIPPTPEDQKTQINSNNKESIGNNSTIFHLY